MKENWSAVKPWLTRMFRFDIRLIVAGATITAAIILVLVDDMNHRIEWFKALAAFGTPLMVWWGFRYTAKTLRYTAQSVQNSTDQLKLEGKSKVDEHFYRAAEHLGDDKSDSQRIAALYMLERMSQEHPDYYHQCIQVICAFVRNRSDMRATKLSSDFKNRPNYLTSDELSVAAEILGRRKHRYLDGQDQPLDLSGADFSGVTFERVDFEGTNFKDASFINTKVRHSNFSFCDFSGSNLRGSVWESTYLVNTVLMMKADSSVTLIVTGFHFVENPLLIVRSLKPHTLSSLLPVKTRPQPQRVPVGFLVAGGTAVDSPQYEEAYRDMAIWKWFLEREHQKDDRGWWWEICSKCEHKVYDEWPQYRYKYADYRWGEQQGPLDE